MFLSNGNSFGNDELNNKYSALAFTGYEDVVARSYEYMAKDSYAPIGFTVAIKAEATTARWCWQSRLSCSPTP